MFVIFLIVVVVVVVVVVCSSKAIELYIDHPDTTAKNFPAIWFDIFFNKTFDI